jgi:hypothetical protein
MHQSLWITFVSIARPLQLRWHFVAVETSAAHKFQASNFLRQLSSCRMFVKNALHKLRCTSQHYGFLRQLNSGGIFVKAKDTKNVSNETLGWTVCILRYWLFRRPYSQSNSHVFEWFQGIEYRWSSADLQPYFASPCFRFWKSGNSRLFNE